MSTPMSDERLAEIIKAFNVGYCAPEMMSPRQRMTWELSCEIERLKGEATIHDLANDLATVKIEELQATIERLNIALATAEMDYAGAKMFISKQQDELEAGKRQ